MLIFSFKFIFLCCLAVSARALVDPRWVAVSVKACTGGKHCKFIAYPHPPSPNPPFLLSTFS